MKSDNIKTIAEALCNDTADESVQAQCLTTLMIGELNTTLVFLKNEVRKKNESISTCSLEQD